MTRSPLHWIVERLFPFPVADAIAGDLLDGFRARRDRVGRAAAAAWLVAQLVRMPVAAVRLGFHRDRSPPVRSRSHPHHTMDHLLTDLVVTARGLARRPIFSAVAVLTLSLGFGAIATIFTLVHGVLLKPLPYPDADRLAVTTLRAPSLDRDEVLFSLAGYELFRDESRAFEAFGAYREFTFNLTGEGEPEELPFLVVSANLFDVLGVPPLHGRVFNRTDETERAFDVAIIGHGLWTRKFGADPGVIGRRVTLGGRPREVVGIMPSGFAFPTPDVQVWIPIELVPGRADPNGHWLRGIGRLAVGSDRRAAVAEASGLVDRLQDAYPEVYRAGPFAAATDLGPWLVSLKDILIGDVRRTLWLLFGSMAVLLLIACANVANLFIVRADARRRELTIRRAVGAGGDDIRRLFVIEGMILAMTGATIGMAIAYVGLPIVAAALPAALPRGHEIGFSGTVVGFGALLTLVIGLAFGLLPSVGGTALGTIAGPSATPGRGRQAMRGGLLLAQVALALMLLVGSGLMVRTFDRLRAVELGFEARNVLTMRISLPPFQYRTPDARSAFWRRFVETIEAVPGVERAGIANALPLDGGTQSAPVSIADRSDPVATSARPALFRVVSPGFFDALGVPLVEGTPLRRYEPSAARREAVVSRVLAERLWPDGSAIGARVRYGPDAPWFTIVGVAGDVREEGLQRPPSDVVYYAAPPMDVPSFMYATIKTTGDPVQYLPAIQTAVWSVDGDLPVVSPVGMAEVVARSMARTSMSMALLLAAASVAVMLGAVGIYGVASHWVSVRTREIGIRIAVGAKPGDVARTVVGQGIVRVVAGIAVGWIGAIGVSRLIRALLFDVSPTDPVVYGVSALVLVAAALAAMYVPARRAAGTDPMTVLRTE